jgi:rhodanese-related sulfurtransferase
MIRLLALFAALILAAPAMAGDAKMAETPMDTVEAKLASGDCYVFDANSSYTREKEGTIEGAVLLTGSSDYDLSVLPKAKDANLVFFCGSTRCTASDKAAVRAAEAGYSNVSVMREGIKGWKAAGKKTVKPDASKS